MKVLLGLAALLIVVFAESENTDLAQNIETAFEHYLRVEKKDVIYPDGFKDKICLDQDCCQAETCEHGTCRDLSNGGNDNIANRYGYYCDGAECGTKAGKYSGTFCNVDAATACDKCASKHGKWDICYPSGVTRFGYICMQKMKNGNYLALDRRELDIMYGEGTATELERIAKEKAEAQVKSKKSLTGLLKRLLAELE